LRSDVNNNAKLNDLKNHPIPETPGRTVNSIRDSHFMFYFISNRIKDKPGHKKVREIRANNLLFFSSAKIKVAEHRWI